jgi:hypothetical protein
VVFKSWTAWPETDDFNGHECVSRTAQGVFAFGFVLIKLINKTADNFDYWIGK